MTVAAAHACRAYALTTTATACLSCKKVRGEGGGRGDQGSSGMGAMRAAAAAAAVPGTSFLCGGRRTMSSLEIDSGLMALIPSGQGVCLPSSSSSHRCHMSLLARKSELLLPPFQDAFLPYLAEAARSTDLLSTKDFGDKPPLLDAIQAKMARDATAATAVRMGATSPAEVSRGGNYGQHKPKRPPPDLPSLLLNSRIIYLGMPLVPAVTELIVAELLYLQWLDPRQPIYMYINSTGTSRADGETVGMETEGFCIYDTMMHVKNEVMTVGVGAAIGQACLLLAAGDKGKRFMLPHATAMIQQPRLPSAGQMTAADISIRAKEVVKNRDTLVELLARHTGNPVEVVAKKMERPFYMNSTKAIKFGVIDKILWQGQEAIAETLSTEAWDDGAGIRVVEKPAYSEGGSI